MSLRASLLLPSRAFVLLAAWSMAAAAPSSAKTATGRVVRVADGDTITVLVGGRQQLRVRLAQIDAPESGQPYGRASRRMLAGLVAGRTVAIRQTDTDQYGRAVALVRQGDTDVNTAMVAAGGAWAYRRYITDPRLIRVEAEARAARRGLWALQRDQIMPPWEWRQLHRAERR